MILIISVLMMRPLMQEEEKILFSKEIQFLELEEMVFNSLIIEVSLLIMMYIGQT